MMFLAIVINCQAQDSLKKDDKVLEIRLITTSVITSALGDGLNSRTKYESGHALAYVSVLSLIALPFVVKPTWKFPVSYILIRYALFDAFYNIGANRKLTYIGGKNFYDETTGKVPLGVLNATKIASIGIVIYLNVKK